MKHYLSMVLLGVSGIALAVAPSMWRALPTKAPALAGNPVTPAKVELGKKLYFDPILSSDGTVSCNSCHNVMSNGTDSRQFSAGVGAREGGRNAPTVWNSVFHSVQFWDGRAATLVEQAKGPLLNPIEMAMPSPEAVEARVQAIPGYVREFKVVFGGERPVTFDNVAKAIAAYESTLITPNTPYDRYVKGDAKALTPLQLKGMNTFLQVGCVTCHSGPMFNGPSQKPGEGFFAKFPTVPNTPYEEKYGITKDPGRFEVTKKEEDRNRWRVPTLRNVAITAPYFHNGSVDTLEEAIRVMSHTQVSQQLTDQQTKEIVAFLHALTGEFPTQTMPRLPEAPSRYVRALKDRAKQEE